MAASGDHDPSPHELPPNIYIIGAQSTGKTTLVSALGDHFAQDASLSQPQLLKEVARGVLTRHNFTASDITNSKERALELQRLIIEAQAAAEGALGNLWYVADRSAIDAVAYARQYVGETEARNLRKGDTWQELEERMRAGVVVVCEPGGEWLRDDGLFPRQLGDANCSTIINAEAAAEAHQIDETAQSRPTSIKTADGKNCLTILPKCGDFRHNLIPLQAQTCDGTNENQKFEIVTKSKHISEDGGMLLVSSSTNGCLDFNAGRKGKEVTMFSCGGRAGGEGEESNSQIFSFAGSQAGIPLTLKKSSEESSETCLAVEDGGKLGFATCGGGGEQSFTLE
ncbi:MAG: hypothetical protein Q9169_007345 [Polycauliona sp. 2 TL-2023]